LSITFLTLDDACSTWRARHPFVDGNERTALMAMLAFLGLNGFRLVAPADEVFDVVNTGRGGAVSCRGRIGHEDRRGRAPARGRRAA